MNINKILTQIKYEFKKVVVDLEYADDSFECVLEEPKDRSHGDWSTNTAMRIAKTAKINPRVLAKQIIQKIDLEQLAVEKLEIAGPGFINIFLKKDNYYKLINNVIKSGKNYGNSKIGNNKKVLFEYVSANPTGYLHIGHARGGAYGDSLSNIMRKAGYDVHREFYVNDAGNQIDNLAKSLEVRYLEQLGIVKEMPKDGYFGKEIIDLAKKIVLKYQDKYLENGSEFFKEYGLSSLLKNLKQHLKEYRVEFDQWYRERDLFTDNLVDKVISQLRDKNYTYNSEGAEWLKTSQFTDEKDRVIYTSDGRNTYLVPDIAYHQSKFERGYDILIDVFGADHHGYIERLKSSMEMLGHDSSKLEFEILQMVKVYQNGEEVKMSKRSGKAIGLQDLIEEVGVDPIRYFFAARALSSPMELDLDLALRKTNENPVYYAQYAHARICSVLKLANEQGITDTEVEEYRHLNENANQILKLIGNYQQVIEECAIKRIPHKLTNYIQNLASEFHSYYNLEKILSKNELETKEKLQFIKAVKIVLKDALNLIGVKEKDKM